MADLSRPWWPQELLYNTNIDNQEKPVTGVYAIVMPRQLSILELLQRCGGDAPLTAAKINYLVSEAFYKEGTDNVEEELLNIASICNNKQQAGSYGYAVRIIYWKQIDDLPFVPSLLIGPIDGNLDRPDHEGWPNCLYWGKRLIHRSTEERIGWYASHGSLPVRIK